MASISSMAATRDEGYKLLREYAPIVAERLGIDPPDIEIHQRYDIEYRRAHELKRMGEFVKAIAEKLEQPPPPKPKPKSKSKKSE